MLGQNRQSEFCLKTEEKILFVCLLIYLFERACARMRGRVEGEGQADTVLSMELMLASISQP